MFTNRKITPLLATAIVALGTGAGVAQAKNGADDPAGHQRHSQTEPGDDHGRTTEPGDDNSRTTEAGDDHGRKAERGHGHKAKAQNDHRRTGRESEHRHGNDDGLGHR